MATNEELQAVRDAVTPQGVGIQTRIYADKAMNAVLDVIERDDLCAQALAIGDELLKEALTIMGDIIRKAS